VYDFYIDQRCYGKGYEEFYRRCQEEGTIFIRGKVAEITDQANPPMKQGKLVAIAEDTLLGRRMRVPVDMVVLCTAMEARADTAEVGRIFGVNQGADGFFLEEHPKLAPLNTATDGVFLAGLPGPQGHPRHRGPGFRGGGQGAGAGQPGWWSIPSTISWIDPDICAGCQVCIGLCPYSAPSSSTRRLVSVVNEALCKGCGSCAGGIAPAARPRCGISRPGQVLAEIDGIMNALKWRSALLN
jgi:heterodisulfide reductase subunit A2